MRTIKPVIIVGQCIPVLDGIGRSSETGHVLNRAKFTIHQVPVRSTNQDHTKETVRNPLNLLTTSQILPCRIYYYSFALLLLAVPQSNGRRWDMKVAERSQIQWKFRSPDSATTTTTWGIIWSGLPKLFRNYFHFYSHKINHNRREKPPRLMNFPATTTTVVVLGCLCCWCCCCCLANYSHLQKLSTVHSCSCTSSNCLSYSSLAVRDRENSDSDTLIGAERRTVLVASSIIDARPRPPRISPHCPFVILWMTVL